MAPTGLSWVGVGLGVGTGRVLSGPGCLVLGGLVVRGFLLVVVVVFVVFLPGLLVVLLGGAGVILGVPPLPPEVQEGVLPPGTIAFFIW